MTAKPHILDCWQKVSNGNQPGLEGQAMASPYAICPLEGYKMAGSAVGGFLVSTCNFTL